ncbi:MAG: hypothetical protein CVU55_08105 [Deltaproteobacteria bacterium HGW-Deltaproteobacteria-13]|jgi:peptidyl-prolyl cis-trans isomerase C|nr:MAG: hypothetical protein CVU55_08105 [Deltaproteobacteria bacterium HGW-Deltaproteobacteria-13]
MKNMMSKSVIAFFVLFAFIWVSGCSEKDKAKKESAEKAVGANQVQTAVPEPPASNSAPAMAGGQAQTGDIAVSVDGYVLKKSELESNVKEKIKLLKDKIPADKQKEYRDSIRKQLVDAFIMRTLLNNEFAKRKIEANNQDIKIMLDKIKAEIPQDKKMDDFIKENRISQEDIIFAVKVNKFVNMEIGEKANPQKKAEAFSAILKNLQKKAKIIIY